ncbi:hypothetical protein pb186bvf_020127 [Paramecium bursaria]
MTIIGRCLIKIFICFLRRKEQHFKIYNPIIRQDLSLRNSLNNILIINQQGLYQNWNYYCQVEYSQFSIKKAISYLKLQRCLLFASNLIFWHNFSKIVTSIWKWIIIRAFKLNGFYKVPYELKKIVPKFVNINLICNSIVPQNYVSERINDIFVQTFKITNLNEELVETISRKKRWKTQLQFIMLIQAMQKCQRSKWEIAIRKLMDNKRSYLYIKKIHSKQFKTFDFGQQYNPLTMRKPKSQEDNLIFRVMQKEELYQLVSLIKLNNQKDD